MSNEDLEVGREREQYGNVKGNTNNNSRRTDWTAEPTSSKGLLKEILHDNILIRKIFRAYDCGIILYLI